MSYKTPTETALAVLLLTRGLCFRGAAQAVLTCGWLRSCDGHTGQPTHFGDSARCHALDARPVLQKGSSGCADLWGACAAVMGKQVTKGFFEGLKEAGANLLPSIWGGDDSSDNSAHAKKGEHAHSKKVDHDHGLGDTGIDSDVRVFLAVFQRSTAMFTDSQHSRALTVTRGGRVMWRCAILHACSLCFMLTAGSWPAVSFHMLGPVQSTELEHMAQCGSIWPFLESHCTHPNVHKKID